MDVDSSCESTNDDNTAINTQRLIADNGGRCMSTQAMQSLYDLRQNKLLCDAVIRLEDGGVFHIHRAILSACSTYFRALFTTTLHSHEQTDVLLPGVSSNTMDLLLEYAYLRTLEINKDNVCQLLITADYLNIIGVLDLCCNYLMENLAPENCIGILRFAREHFCRGLEADTYRYVMRNFVQVDQVDPTGPRAYHGTAVVGFNIYVIGGFDGIDYFNSCRCFNAVTKVWREVAPMNARRCYVSVAVLKDMVYAMGGYDGYNRQNSAERYNYKKNQWSYIAPMYYQRSDASATTLNDKIYITGGFNGQECMNTAEVYDPETNQWTMIAPLRSRRSGVSCISYHNYIYVIGGFNGVSRMCSGEKYNPETDSWAPIPDMYHPRSNFAIEVIDDMIFVIGGFNGVTTIFRVECYDGKHNEWYEATDMNVYRSALSACVIMGLPNVEDYIHKHRERLMEEKRQKLLALEMQRAQQLQIQRHQGNNINNININNNNSIVHLPNGPNNQNQTPQQR